MGEAKQEEAKAEAKPEEKKEEVKQEEKKEEKAEEEKKEEVKPSPPPPIVLFVDLHCVGCAKKIERSILKCRGVEAVEIDMVKNQVTVKGIVDPQALCSRIQKKTMRNVKVLSPLPPAADGDSAKSDVITSQVSGLTTVELHVSMHCEACAQQLRRKILKMRGVQAAETEQSAGKVTVTGTMKADRLVEYVYRRTRKLARLVPPPPPKEEESKKEEGEKKVDAAAEEKPPQEENKEAAKKEEDKAAEKKEEEKSAPPPQDNSGGGGKEEEKPAEGGGGGDGAEEQKKEGEGNAAAEVATNVNASDYEDTAKKMMYWAPVYVIEQLPPPQLFSDENPNACCIS